ncbi:MAG: Gfo/Idh/MocA family oxidoreductase [Chloroflexota bacterium]
MAVRFGILGSGFMAATYAQCLAAHVPDGVLTAVALGSRAPELAARHGVAVEASAEALLARPDVDAVIIATPHSTHLPLTRLAAAAGRHVYCEKPMARDVAECDAMIAACREAGVALTVNKVTRFRQVPRTVKRLLDEGAIGELRMVRITSSVEAYLPDETGWTRDPAEGGAWLDMGCHLFDALRWFTGTEATSVFADVRDFGDTGLRRSGMAQVRLSNGVMCQLWISFEMPAPGLGSQSQWLFVGSDGMIEADAYGIARAATDGDWRQVDEMPWFDKNADILSPVRLAAFAAQVQDLAEAIRDGRLPEVGGLDGRAAVELVEATARSSELGASVALPLG